MKITICQLNPLVGDIEGNLKKIVGVLSQTRAQKPDLIIFPELFLTGYPPHDLLEKPWFIKNCNNAVQRLVNRSREYPGTAILLGAPSETGLSYGRGLYNSALFIHNGKVEIAQNKSLLPGYDVFDEGRYFDVARDIKLVKYLGEKLGVSICEDAWNHDDFWPRRRPYDNDPIALMAQKGATMLINISASPFEAGKDRLRHYIISKQASKYKLPFVYVNQIGGNDELIFDGGSFAVNEEGHPMWQLPAFSEEVFAVDSKHPPMTEGYRFQEKTESVYNALKMGIKDYFKKCGFKTAVLGLSGGIDSAVVAAMAADALGPDNVLGITMPSPFSSKGSVDDSKKLAGNLGIKIKEISINEIYEKYLETLNPHFERGMVDLTEENIQARIRGNILMAFSNKFGHLVLTTGNKSELAVGYCTLYGDMSGGLAVVSDVPKTMVYQLAEYINRTKEIIPKNSISKAPSAELRPDQTDQDTLPPYDVLDKILDGYLEGDLSSEELVTNGFDKDTVEWVINAVRLNEHKRRQSVPGLKVAGRAFGGAHRMPVAAKY